MHYKTKRKLEAAKRVYLRKDDYFHSAVIQLQTEYLDISLEKDFPNKLNYIKINNGGFSHKNDIKSFSKYETLDFLEKSKTNKSINSNTVETLKDLINNMNNF